MNTKYKTDVKDKLLEFCQDNLTLKGKKYICPYCGSGTGKNGTPAFTIYDTKFFCHKCEQGGDIYDLAKQLNISEEQLNKTYSLGATKTAKIKPFPSKIKKQDNKNNQNIDEIQPDYSKELKEWAKQIANCNYLDKRGISKETQKRFGVGFCKEWKHPKTPQAPITERVIIPTSKNSYLARAIKADVKKEYQKQKVGKANLFNLQALKNFQSVFITEGEIDALSLEDLGFSAVALGSISNQKKLVEALEKIEMKPFLFLCLDNDEAGQKAQKELETKLDKIEARYMEANNILGQYKDANEALLADRETLKNNLKKVVSLQEKQNEARAKHEKPTKKQKIKSVLDEAQSTIYNLWEHPTKQYRTGLTRLDDLLGGGFNAGTLSVLGASPSVGKTTLALQIACNIAKAGDKVLFFSLEMSKAEVVAKIISREIRENEKPEKWLTTNEILTCNKYTETDAKKQETALKQTLSEWLKNIYIITFNEQAGIEELKDTIKDFIEEQEQAEIKPFVIVDYIHILKPESQRDERQNIGQIITKLKKLAVNYNLHLMGIIPFNRAGAVEADLTAGRETSNIEYTTDYFIGLDFDLNIEETETAKGKQKALIAIQEAKNKLERNINIKLLKNRNGGLGTLKAIYDTKHNFFYPKPKKNI